MSWGLRGGWSGRALGRVSGDDDDDGVDQGIRDTRVLAFTFAPNVRCCVCVSPGV